MKIKLQKLFLCIVVTITIFNLFTSILATSVNQVYASSSTTVVNEIDEEAEDDSFLDKITSLTPVGVLDGLVGILSKATQIPILLIGMGIHGLISGIAKLGDSEIEGFVTPDDIFFNRIGITNIDFFTLSGNGDTVVQTIRINIATWYYILRVFATVILLAVLIYIGIRMALSTVASEQAQYKRMLKDWAVSFALLFLLNYIIMFTIQANNALIELLKGPAKVTIGDGVPSTLAKMAITGISATKSWAAFIVYFGLIGFTAAFLLLYIKRMLTIGFLIIISPLITITYSIDKVKDGRAQAVNTWLKEFMYNVLIQPFHCIIYLVFISTILNSLGAKASLSKLLLAIICMKFIWKAEEIMKHIFGFNASSMPENKIAAFATVSAISKTLSKQGGKVANTVANNTSFGQNIKNRIGSTRVGRTYNNLRQGYNTMSQRNDLIGAVTRKVGPAFNPRKQFSKGVGAAVASMELGANTSINSLHAGFEAYNIANNRLFGDDSQPGSQKSIENSQNEFEKFANFIEKNSRFNFQNYRTDINSKNQLKAYAQSLIGTNMDHLNHNIQDALRDITTTDPEYNINRPDGMQHLKALQDMALSSNLDFSSATTNPLGRAWTRQEMDVVTAIQIRNLAQAVNGLNSNYQAAGRPNPNQDVDDYIGTLT